MKNSLKNLLIESFKNETPDLKENVIKKCKNVVQEEPLQNTSKRAIFRVKLYKTIIAFSLALLFCGGLLTGYFAFKPAPSQNPTVQTYLYLDADPSIEIALDENNLVLECNPLNKNAQEIVQGMNFKGMDIQTTVNSIVGSMHLNGFISSNGNSVLVSISSSSPKAGDLLSKVTKQINSAVQKTNASCSVIGQAVPISKDLVTRANENGISVGKMFLIDKMAEDFGGAEETTVDILSNMSIKDLNFIYLNRPGSLPPNGEVVQGSLEGYLSQEEAIQKLLDYLSITLQDIRIRFVKVVPYARNDKKLVYLIEFEYASEVGVYDYEVDCLTGEVTVGMSASNGRMIVQ